jgi:2-polyprenyl-6-methoxyphenol hydroxylase-like FAD-dependent oxidoreductase
VFAVGTPARVGRGGPTVLESIVRDASPVMAERVRAATPPPGVRTFGGQPGYLRQAWGPGWALVGDAGSWKDPISAHGLTDAFRDAELLAGAVVADGPDGYAAYEATRDRLTTPILAAADEIAAFSWDDDRIVALLKIINAAMVAEVELIERFTADTRASDARPLAGRAAR